MTIAALVQLMVFVGVRKVSEPLPTQRKRWLIVTVCLHKKKRTTCNLKRKPSHQTDHCNIEHGQGRVLFQPSVPPQDTMSPPTPAKGPGHTQTQQKEEKQLVQTQTSPSKHTLGAMCEMCGRGGYPTQHIHSFNH